VGISYPKTRADIRLETCPGQLAEQLARCPHRSEGLAKRQCVHSRPSCPVGFNAQRRLDLDLNVMLSEELDRPKKGPSRRACSDR
jgi:hypothetical protein